MKTTITKIEKLVYYLDKCKKEIEELQEVFNENTSLKKEYDNIIEYIDEQKKNLKKDIESAKLTRNSIYANYIDKQRDRNYRVDSKAVSYAYDYDPIFGSQYGIKWTSDKYNSTFFGDINKKIHIRCNSTTDFMNEFNKYVERNNYRSFLN